MHLIAKVLLLAGLQAFVTYLYFRKRIAIYLVLGLFVLGGLYLEIQPVDDMFIALRFARNWASGFGPVFNPGERVEGYTCFLWVSMLAGLNRLGFDPVIAARSLSVLFALVSLYLLHTYSRRNNISDFNRAAAVCLLAFNLPQAYWAFVGMEATLSGFLILLMTLSFLKWMDKKEDLYLGAASILGAIAAMTRPEAIVLFGVSWIWCFVLSERKARHLLFSGLCFLMVFGPYLLWRYSYYGYLLPNTYYVKVDRFGLSLFIRGWKYSLLFLIPNFLLILPIAFSLLKKPLNSKLLYISSLAAAHCFSVTIEGGDHYSASRLFVPIIPLLALLWCENSVSPKKFSPGIMVSLMVTITFLAGFFFRGYKAFETAAGGARAQSIAVWLTRHVPPDTLIATMSVGVVPYYSNLPTLDLLGLVDAHISHSPAPLQRGKGGHEKFDNDYVMKRNPGVFLFAKCYKNEATLMNEAKAIVPMYRDLLTRFFPNPDYVFVKVRREGRYCSSLLVRKDLARNWKLDKTGMFLSVSVR